VLSTEEKLRYDRHLLLPEIGMEGQHKLKNASVLVIGAGGLGCPALLYLAAAGVGKIGIVDFDVVDISNLPRQILFSAEDAGKKKCIVAKEKLEKQNPFIQIQSYDVKLSPDNAFEIIYDYQIVVDGSDNFPTRYLLNDLCVKLDKPLVSGSVFKFSGQVGVFNLNGSGSYRCLFPHPPSPEEMPDCDTIGVLGVLPGIIGAMQASEAIKIITGFGDVLANQLMILDLKKNQQQLISYTPNEEIILQTKNLPVLTDEEYQLFCSPKKDDPLEVKEILPEKLKQMIREQADFELIDVREQHERSVISLGGELFPLNTLLQHANEISKEKQVIFYCKTGARSQAGIRQLQEEFGFRNLYNLKGGIRAYFSEK
jgi:molybdopterin/thiamine biosynthesis adenylyltransferase/rhodanese-related sulfurtransferase